MWRSAATRTTMAPGEWSESGSFLLDVGVVFAFLSTLTDR
jgi:hypothetical protein